MTLALRLATARRRDIAAAQRFEQLVRAHDDADRPPSPGSAFGDALVDYLDASAVRQSLEHPRIAAELARLAERVVNAVGVGYAQACRAHYGREQRRWNRN